MLWPPALIVAAFTSAPPAVSCLHLSIRPRIPRRRWPPHHRSPPRTTGSRPALLRLGSRRRPASCSRQAGQEEQRPAVARRRNERTKRHSVHEGKGGRRDGGAAGAAWSYDLWLLALPPALVTAFPGASTTEPVPELVFQDVWQGSSRSRFWSCSRSPAKRALEGPAGSRLNQSVYEPPL